MPHSVLNKQHNANSYHRVREAVPAGIVNMVHIDSEFNLADMGTKSLGPAGHQRLLQNQVFPPASTAGECQTVIMESTEKVPVRVQASQARTTTHNEQGDATLSIPNVDRVVMDFVSAVEEEEFMLNLLHASSMSYDEASGRCQENAVDSCQE